MSRAERLLDLLQLFRQHRRPVAGPDIADEFGVSLRTVYRDIATLQGQGADIQGEPGIGYVMKPGFTLPPLMFDADEIEALVLGSRWVAARSDDQRLEAAATNALSKISAVLRDDLRRTVNNATFMVPPSRRPVPAVDLSIVRLAIRDERKLGIAYQDDGGARTERDIWPFAIGFFDAVRVIGAWCELRNDFRNFRLDRIAVIEPKDERYPRRRAVLLKEWREREGITPLSETVSRKR